MFSLKPSRKKNEIMKFLGFSKIWRGKFQKYISIEKFFFFWKKYIFEIFSPDFGTSQKFHVFVFSLLGIERKSFSPEKDFSFLEIEIEISGDFSFIRLFSRFNLPPPRPHLLLPNLPRSCHQNHQKLILPEQLLPPKPHPRCR